MVKRYTWMKFVKFEKYNEWRDMFTCCSCGSRDDFAASFAAGLAKCCSKNSTWWTKSSAGKTGSFKPREFIAPFFHNIGLPRESAFKTMPFSSSCWFSHLQQFHGSSDSGMSSRYFTKRLDPSYARRLGSLVIAMSLSLWRGNRSRCLCRESLRANSSLQDVQGYFLLGLAVPIKFYWIKCKLTNADYIKLADYTYVRFMLVLCSYLFVSKS